MIKRSHDLSACYRFSAVISDRRRWRRARSCSGCASTRSTLGACRPSSQSWGPCWRICPSRPTSRSCGLASAKTNAGSMVSSEFQELYGFGVNTTRSNARAINIPFFPLNLMEIAGVCSFPGNFFIVANVYPRYAINFLLLSPPKHAQTSDFDGVYCLFSVSLPLVTRGNRRSHSNDRTT